MTFDAEDKLCFLVCWEDRQSGLLRNFHLYFYPSSNSVEMFDIKTRKVFLKKTPTDKISRGDLYIGNTILLYARSLKVMDYGDDVTRDTCSRTSENTLALVKPGAVGELGQILTRVGLEGITMARAKMVHLGRHQAEHFYRKFTHDPLFDDLVTDLMSDVCVVMELVGNNVLRKWLSIISLKAASDEAEDTVSDLHSKTVYGSASQQAAEEDISYFFPSSRLLSSSIQTPSSRYLPLTNTSCCVIRPHAYSRAGEIIEAILTAGFQIAALETFILDFGKSDEFLEVYKGVIENYGNAVIELSSGACIALQIVSSEDDDVVTRFRELCGPQDPAIAKTLRPKTLRARFGESLTKNGVHCSDLKEDGPLEVEYFFSVLQ